MRVKGLGSTSLALVGALALSAAIADAGVSTRVRKAFRGKILVTANGLPAPSGSDKATIASYRKAHQSMVKHTMVDGLATWTWQYTAFLKRRPMVTQLSFDFYTADKKREFRANEKIGIDPRITILSGAIKMDEDDNLTKGQTYIVKLTGTVRGREVVFATTKLTTK